jgi:hypothetical protein
VLKIKQAWLSSKSNNISQLITSKLKNEISYKTFLKFDQSNDQGNKHEAKVQNKETRCTLSLPFIRCLKTQNRANWLVEPTIHSNLLVLSFNLCSSGFFFNRLTSQRVYLDKIHFKIVAMLQRSEGGYGGVSFSKTLPLHKKNVWYFNFQNECNKVEIALHVVQFL